MRVYEKRVLRIFGTEWKWGGGEREREDRDGIMRSYITCTPQQILLR
jgi:hypothetical protein